MRPGAIAVSHRHGPDHKTPVVGMRVAESGGGTSGCNGRVLGLVPWIRFRSRGLQLWL
jgi:hypothetical protein